MKSNANKNSSGSLKSRVLFFFLLLLSPFAPGPFSLSLALAQPAPLRLESVVLAPSQPFNSDPAVIWYDDFDRDRIATYMEPAAGSAWSSWHQPFQVAPEPAATSLSWLQSE